MDKQRLGYEQLLCRRAAKRAHQEERVLFIELETCCRGPVEFNLAHAPEEVSAHYPGVNHDLLPECRILVLAMITTWRWDRGDQLPYGRQLGTEWLSQVRAALERKGLDIIHG